jgi:hypothetical protein
MNVSIEMELVFDWIPVPIEDGTEYHFPQSITALMRQQYRAPAIYRWHVYQNQPGDLRIAYIGETHRLCPDRINGYLFPGPSQMTNLRLNAEFKSHASAGRRIRLEVLTMETLRVDNIRMTVGDLADADVRRTVEKVLTIHYWTQGWTLLNA